MRTDVCDVVRVDISARLDGELDDQASRALDEHIDRCASCHAYERRLKALRRTLRVHSAESVPDLGAAIMTHVRAERPRVQRRREWRSGLRVATLAAAVAALILFATSLPFSERQPQSANASEIVRRVRAAAQDLDTYRATFSIVERGLPIAAVNERRFSAEVFFDAPERFRLRVRDLTTYPDARWPANDVDLIASPRRWWIEQPHTCPIEVVLECSVPQGTSKQTVVARQPFDGTSTLPTDIVVPLETLASSGNFEVLERARVAGRDAVRINLPMRAALPLVTALQPGGLWRSFHGLDPVDIWVDERTWFPLRFEVRAGASRGRAAWARTEGYEDQAGAVLLEVRARRFSRGSINARLFSAPLEGAVRSGEFSASGEPPEKWVRPSYTAGLEPHRNGRTPDGRWVMSWSRGMTWLKVTGGGGRNGSALPVSAEEVRLDGGGWAYYQPAAEDLKRRVELFEGNGQLYLESNLARSELLAVAASLGINGERLPRHIGRTEDTTVKRLDLRAALDLDFVGRPADLPDGYRPSAAVSSSSRLSGKSVTVYYRRLEAEYGGDGIRVTQSPGIKALVPSSESSILYDLDGIEARWLVERGQLEWIDAGVYRSVTVPAGDLATAYQIARSLR
ncbi:MAG: zf-HC2 domain-containing protein [Actinomycetota bacterium]